MFSAVNLTSEFSYFEKMGWELRIKKFVYYEGLLKNLRLSTKGGLQQFADLRGGLAKKGVVFLRGRGIDTQMYVMGNQTID